MFTRCCALIALLVVGTQAASAQAGSRPGVAIEIGAGAAGAMDSSSAYAAVRRGLEHDALVDVVASARGARYLMHVTVIGSGDQLRAEFRVMALENATVVHRMAVSANRGAMGDSLAAVASRCARTLVAR